MFAPEREAVVLVSVGEEVVGRAVEHEAAGGALGGGRPLAQEALPLALPALGLGLALLPGLGHGSELPAPGSWSPAVN